MPSSFRRHGTSNRARASLIALSCALAGLSCASASAARAREASFDGALSSAAADVETRGRATREEIASARGTYIDRILVERDSVLDRWPDRVADPVRVWIDAPPDGTPATQLTSAVRSAFEEWGSTGIPLRFQFVPDAGNAEVRVRWVTLLPNKTGSTSWRSTRDGWLRSGDVTLATHTSAGGALDPDGVHAIALHEIGHVIGLSHSNDGHDIMAPLVRVDEMSEADRATVRLLYKFSAGRIR